MLLGRCRLSDKLTASFKPRHARWYGRMSIEIGRSMGGSVATSYKVVFLQISWCKSLSSDWLHQINALRMVQHNQHGPYISDTKTRLTKRSVHTARPNLEWQKWGQHNLCASSRPGTCEFPLRVDKLSQTSLHI